MNQLFRFLGAGILVAFVLAAAFRCAGAEAGTATVTWTNPTQRTDGTALPASVIGSTKVEWSASSTFSPLAGSQTLNGAGTTLTVNSLGAGNWFFRAFTTTTTGAVSAASNVASKIVPESPPVPPTLTTISTLAFEWQYGPDNRLRLVEVGRLALGTPCGAAYGRDARFATVGYSDVTFRKPWFGGILYSVCG